MPPTMPFQSGDLVVVVLQSPRERVWGCLLELDAAGITLRGLDLTPWEEVLALVRTSRLTRWRWAPDSCPCIASKPCTWMRPAPAPRVWRKPFSAGRVRIPMFF